MDKLRALQYFIATAEERSLSAAARRLDVSVPSVFKLISALELRLGVSLFDRSPRGISLTADGAAYFERCRPLLEALEEADAAIARGGGPHGCVVIGAPAYVASACLGPELPGFHARFPDIELDVRVLQRLTDPQADGVDVFVMFGWQESSDLVQRPICPSRYVVVGSAAYWAAHDLPQHPRELARHPCVLYRSGTTVLDEWRFERGGETESLRMRGWLSTSNRELLIGSVLAGQGIARLHIPPRLPAGVVPVLPDWTALEPPPVHLLYKPQHRRSARVRCVIDFIVDIFAPYEPGHERRGATTERPMWWDRYRRSSRASRRPDRGA